MRAPNRRGYTLIELVVTVLIIGILTSIAVPQYLRTVETGKADDAVAAVNMIGTTNKMFALDHAGVYVTGGFPGAPAGCGSAAGTGGPSCGVGAPGACAAAPSGNGCDLVWCKYLADQDWADKPYTYNACNGASGTTALAMRAMSGSAGTTITPYSTWGYTVTTAGQITGVVVTAPAPTF